MVKLALQCRSVAKSSLSTRVALADTRPQTLSQARFD
jgi:hypothetical protein